MPEVALVLFPLLLVDQEGFQALLQALIDISELLHVLSLLESTPRAHLVPSFILPELNIHLEMFKMKILKLNLIHSAFIFSVILVPNLWLGACCRCRARVCR